MKNYLLFFISAFSFVCSPLVAWWDAGHMAIAQLAYEELNPDVRNKVDAYLEAASDSFPRHADFISASVWADDIVHEGISAFFSWHGSARPYDPYNLLTSAEKQRMVDRLKGNDIIWAINECIKTLQKQEDSLSESSFWAKGFMLRMLIHIIGDIHQPSHCITLYSPQFPEGDKFGTRYKLNHPIYKSLHALFDGAFGLADRVPQRPPSLEDKEYLNGLIAHLRKTFPREELQELEDEEFDHWRQKSYEIGVQFAYAKITNDEEIPLETIEEGKLVTGRLLALSGYRLADLLNRILK